MCLFLREVRGDPELRYHRLSRYFFRVMSLFQVLKLFSAAALLIQPTVAVKFLNSGFTAMAILLSIPVSVNTGPLPAHLPAPLESPLMDNHIPGPCLAGHLLLCGYHCPLCHGCKRRKYTAVRIIASTAMIFLFLFAFRQLLDRVLINFLLLLFSTITLSS